MKEKLEYIHFQGINSQLFFFKKDEIDLKKNQIEHTEMKNTITKMKKTQWSSLTVD